MKRVGSSRLFLALLIRYCMKCMLYGIWQLVIAGDPDVSLALCALVKLHAFNNFGFNRSRFDIIVKSVLSQEYVVPWKGIGL